MSQKKKINSQRNNGLCDFEKEEEKDVTERFGRWKIVFNSQSAKTRKKNPERVKEKVRRSIICWGCWGCFRDGRGVRGAFEPSASRSYHLTRHGHMTNISILYFTKQFEFNNNNFCSDENRITSANIYLFILGILCLSY